MMDWKQITYYLNPILFSLDNVAILLVVKNWNQFELWILLYGFMIRMDLILFNKNFLVPAIYTVFKTNLI